MFVWIYLVAGVGWDFEVYYCWILDGVWAVFGCTYNSAHRDIPAQVYIWARVHGIFNEVMILLVNSLACSSWIEKLACYFTPFP